MVWSLDRAACLNFTTVARVDGLTPAAVEAGLAAVRARHPGLRLRIVPDARGYPVFLPCDRALPLRIGGAELVAELEAELETPFHWTEGPLARSVYLPHSGHLLLTFQHCISDGHSGVFAVRDLLAAAAAHLRGEAPALASFDAHISADHRLPRRVRGLRYWAPTARFAARLAWSAARLGRPLLASDAEVEPGERAVRVVPASFEPAFVSALVERSRAEGTTVHGVLGAVHMQAIAADAGARTLQYASPVNLRPHLEPPVADQVGYYVGASNTSFAVDPDEGPWPLARALRESVLRDVRQGTSMLLNRFGPQLYRRFTRGEAPVELVARRLYALRGTTGMTNLGRVALDARLEPLQVESLWFAVATSALGDQVTTATCFGGRLFWNLCVATPTVDLERAKRTWADAHVRLERSV